MELSTSPVGSTSAGPALVDLEMISLGGSPGDLLDAVRRNLTAAAGVLGALTEVSFRCGCHLTLASGPEAGAHWRIMAWNDSRCGSATHQAVKAKWEASNL